MSSKVMGRHCRTLQLIYNASRFYQRHVSVETLDSKNFIMFTLLISCMVLLSRALAVPTLSPRQSNIPYGTVIYSCTQPGVVALTFDDGPYVYTEELLNLLAANGQRATFFVNGQNWDNINNYASTIQRMVADGHQVGSHT